MAKARRTKKNLSVQHRAACEDDSFRGPWRSSKDDAISDASDHRKEAGNRDHVINIITKQTEISRFNG